MRSMRKLGVLVAVFALCAIGAANASAAEFTTTNEGGKLTVKSAETQIFKIHGGNNTLTCDKIHVTGNATPGSSQEVTVHYTECMEGSVPVHVGPATYEFTDDGEVHILAPITIEVTVPIFADCHITVGKQTVKTVDYIDNADGTITLNPTVTGISYTTTGGFCGAGGTDGTYSGSSTIGVEGGEVNFDK